MGVDYNQLGEDFKSSNQEKERKIVWVERAELLFTFSHAK
jgi:hypothetical protein